MATAELRQGRTILKNRRIAIPNNPSSMEAWEVVEKSLAFGAKPELFVRIVRHD
jgi:hypothetical protein